MLDAPKLSARNLDVRAHVVLRCSFYGTAGLSESGNRAGVAAKGVYPRRRDFTVRYTGLNHSRPNSAFTECGVISIPDRDVEWPFSHRRLSMSMATEIVQLLVQSAGSWLFEGTRSGLSDREWMALRFLALANRLSRTPTALAGFLGTTRSGVSQITAALLDKGLVVRKPSAEDKRSITLCVTAEGKKLLEHDPINTLRDQIVALDGSDRAQLRDTLRRVLVGLDVAERRHHTDVCGQCVFLVESGEGKDRYFKCRLFRKSITATETSQLCTYFEGRS